MTDTKKPAPLTLTDLDELERLEREASAGPWERDDTQARHSINSDMRHIALVSCWKESSREGRENEANASLIPAARNRLPQLLALARVGLLAVAENEAQKAVPRGPVVEGMDLTTTQAWMLASENLDAAIDAYKEKHK